MLGLELHDLPINRNPPAGFHFAVIFFAGGVFPSPLDTHFQKVKGISSEIESMSLNEGGENLFVRRLPSRVKYGNLVLERGFLTGSLLTLDFEVAMTTMRIVPGNILVALLNDYSVPISAWFFWKTYPVKWSISDLDATSNSVVIDTMELAYTRFQSLRI